MPKRISEPIIYKTKYHNMENWGIEDLSNDVADQINEEKKEYIVNYPTVYIIEDEKHKDRYRVYVGETNDIRQRTLEHLKVDPKDENRKDWQDLEKANDSEMYVIGHNHFNKSLTLDIENQLMLYLSSVPAIEKVNNRRNNFQSQYYTSDERDEIFKLMWKKLHQKNGKLFPAESLIKDTAIFKAFPFHKLTNEQLTAKLKIYEKVKEALENNEQGQLILVEGEAGAGKTVLLSNLFYDLKKTKLSNGEYVDARIFVRHDEQQKVYQEISKKLGFKDSVIDKPIAFLKDNDYADVVLIDEAHLLLTQFNQSYTKKISDNISGNQLKDFLSHAKVVIAILDERQMVAKSQMLRDSDFNELEKLAGKNIIRLENQMRMQANSKTSQWIKDFIYKQEIKPLPQDDNYEIKFFDDPDDLEQAIKEKDKDQEYGISRMVATYDWEYKRKPKGNGEFWNVEIGDWKKPWNYQVDYSRKDVAWAEIPETIDEIGSIFTVQGFDLNYCGLIIGPSVKYRDGKVVFDESASCDDRAKGNRKFDEKSESVGLSLIKNALNVLMTRGVHGLFIYAVDDKLRGKLENLNK